MINWFRKLFRFYKKDSPTNKAEYNTDFPSYGTKRINSILELLGDGRKASLDDNPIIVQEAVLRDLAIRLVTLESRFNLLKMNKEEEQNDDRV